MKKLAVVALALAMSMGTWSGVEAQPEESTTWQVSARTGSSATAVVVTVYKDGQKDELVRLDFDLVPSEERFGAANDLRVATRDIFGGKSRRFKLVEVR